MIADECASEPVVRAAELDLAGRRVAARLWPSTGQTGSPHWRFDPIERRFLPATSQGPVVPGPCDAEAWRAAVARVPAGPVAVGPGDAGLAARRAYLAAALGASLAGRGVYLLEPPGEELPSGHTEAFVALFCVLPAEGPSGDLSASVARGLTSGVCLPLVPGWTTPPEQLERVTMAASSAGARFVAGVEPVQDGASRRSIVEARAELDPSAPETFFEHVHHGDWSREIDQARLDLRQICARHRIGWLPFRPIGSGEHRANARAAARLEERADAVSSDEHRASRLHAAARWIDESGKNLAAIVRERNFLRIFPLGADLGREAEEAFQEISCE